MANFNLTIELTKLFGANRVTTKSGQEVIVIPIDSNPITIGKNGTKEIDFVCDKDGKRIYVQVCYLLASEKTEQREFGA